MPTFKKLTRRGVFPPICVRGWRAQDGRRLAFLTRTRDQQDENGRSSDLIIITMYHGSTISHLHAVVMMNI